MRKRFIFLAVWLALFTGMVFLTQTGCPNNTPATPAAPTPTPTVLIEWAYAGVQHYDYFGSPSVTSFVQLRANGQPVTNAGVTLFGTFPGAPQVLTYLGPATFSGQVFGSYENGSFTYQAGATYILSTTALGKTASVTSVAPGNMTLGLDSNGAVTLVSWAVEGDKDHVIVDETPANVRTFGVTSGDVDSPVTIPSTAYPGASGSTYQTEIRLGNSTTFVSNALVTFGKFDIWDQKDRGVTIP